MSPRLSLESYDVLRSYYCVMANAECTYMVSRLNGEGQRAEDEEREVQGGKEDAPALWPPPPSSTLCRQDGVMQQQQ